MPKSINRKFDFPLRARVAVPGCADGSGMVVARTQAITAENSYRVEFRQHGALLLGDFGEAALRAVNPRPDPIAAAPQGSIDSVQRFLRDATRRASGESVTARALYHAYVRHALDTGAAPVSEKRFALVAGAVYARARDSRGHFYVDVALRQSGNGGGKKRRR